MQRLFFDLNIEQTAADEDSYRNFGRWWEKEQRWTSMLGFQTLCQSFIQMPSILVYKVTKISPANLNFYTKKDAYFKIRSNFEDLHLAVSFV